MSSGKEISRRSFLKTAGVACAGPLVAAEAFGQSPGESGSKVPEEAVVPTRPFGKTGVNVSILSLGGMFDIPSNQLLMRQALKWGVTYWDTADCYEGGNSELGIGQFFKKNPDARKRIFLVTKSDSRDPAGITKLLNRSLEKMNTDYIDLYFIHGVSRISELNEETRKWAENAKNQGKIKFFGFSAHSNMEDLMLAAAKLGWIDGLMVTYNFRIMRSDKMKAAVDACAKAGIGLCAMKTQGGGSVSVESETEIEMAGKFLQKGFTDAQAKIKAVWANPHIASVCSQMPNMTVLMSNVAAALDKTKLTAEDLTLMERYAMETSSSYCAGCAELCESAVACEAPIRDVMRYLMYYHSYGERDRARELFSRLSPETREKLVRIDFTPAEKRCPQGLKIGKLMMDAAVALA